MNRGAPTRSGRHAAWLGPLLAVVGLVSYFTLFVRFPALRDVPWVNLPMVVAGLGLALWALARRRTLWRWLGAGVSALCVVLLAGYVFVLSSRLPDRAQAVAVGALAPPFELADHTGRSVQLDDFAGTRLVLVFYRGFW